MSRVEWIETAIMIAVIVLWWPSIFSPVFPAWFGFAAHPAYRALLFYGTPIPVIAIFVRRLVRYRRAASEMEETADQRAQVDTDRRLR